MADTSKQFTLRWGILATGGIAKTFTKDLLVDPSTRNVIDIAHVVAAAASSTSRSRAQDFLTTVGAPSTAKAYGSYTELVSDPDVDIIYVATPHSHHYEHARLALEAGKHVLVEKPATVNAKQTEILIETARTKKLFFMEAVWTRFFPLAREVRSIIQSGALGRIVRVWADLSFWNDVEKEFGTEHRMVNLDLAGGALLDLGIYPLTWLFQTLYHVLPEEKQESPRVASALTKYEATGCDETTSVILHFPTSGAQGIATTSIRVKHDPSEKQANSAPECVRIQGTLGDIHIPGPCYRPQSYSVIPAFSNSRGTVADWEYKEVQHEIPGNGHGMFYEADECARCVRDGMLESEGMPWRETLELMRVMDQVRKDGGLDYGELESVEYKGVA